MLTKKYVIIIVVCVIFFVGLGILSTRVSPAKTQDQTPVTPTEAVKYPHYHAGFQIYIDGELQDYSGLRYMHLKPCTVEGAPDHDTDEKYNAEDEVIERAHLHDGDGDVVHMHRDGVTWADLLSYLKVSVENKPVSLYIDGILQPEADAPVKPYMSAQFFVGTPPEDISQLIESRVTKDRILAVEKKSESCGKD